MSVMAKKRKKKSTKPIIKNGKKVTPKTGRPASQRVTASRCAYCRCEDTYIYCTKGRTRHCKCSACGYTWSKAVSDPKPG